MAKKIILPIIKFLLCIVAFLLIWVCAAFVLPHIKVNKDYTSCSAGDCVNMFVRSNGMHTDVVFPVVTPERDWRTIFPPEIFEGVDSTFKYVAIGWGDKGFYLDTPTWAEVKVSTILKATIGVSGSAIHITYLKEPPAIGEFGKQLGISSDQYNKMLSYIDENMVKGDDGNVLLIKHPPFDINDNYYEAKGSYSLFKTCNVWTSKCLKLAGIQNGIWAPSAAGVMNSLP